jgi:glycosyltransferase involved in cell wall biosynthesis
MGTRQHHRIALVMIARDEARSIKRCLASVKPWVDQLIVLDTGSTDNTVQIAADCGATVFPFKWIDDFSEARNAALSYSDADWNLILDADEWLVSGAECLAQAVLGNSPFVGVVNVTSSFKSGESTSTTVNWISRLLPRGIRYAGRIHEQPQSTLPRKRLPLVIGHDGYEPQRLESKRGRNAALLKIELSKNPENSYVLYQLGKDSESYEDYAQASTYYQLAWERAVPSDGFRHSLVTRRMYSMSKSGQLEEAVQFATAQMDHWQSSPDFFFVLGNLLLDLAVKNPYRAFEELLPLAEICWQRCLEIGESPQLDDSVVGRGSFLAEHNLEVVRGRIL